VNSGGPQSAGREWLPSLQSLLGTVVIAIFVITFVVQAFQIPSESMENTLLIGDYLLVNKLCYGDPAGSYLMPYRAVHRGDIIVFKYPVDPSQHFVKRVIGVPGDHIKLVNAKVFVNGVALKEPYAIYSSPIRDQFRDNFPQLNMVVPGLEEKWWQQMQKLVVGGELIVPRDSYFVLGDNRDESLDSRYWGFVPRANIVGRPLVIYWSVRDTSEDMPQPASMSDKVLHFTYALTHLVQITRWNRTFRIIR
jgi:signal peptidase I